MRQRSASVLFPICFYLCFARFDFQFFLFSHHFLIICLISLYLLATPFSSMKFVLIFHRCSDGFGSHVWCFFDTTPVRTCNLLNHQKLLILPFREIRFLMIFLILFVTSFGIDCWWVLVLVLVPFWDPSGIKLHGDRFFDKVVNLFFIDCWSKWLQKIVRAVTPFHSFFAFVFRTLVPFTNVRRTSARNHVNHFFFQKQKRIYPHLYLLLP